MIPPSRYRKVLSGLPHGGKHMIKDHILEAVKSHGGLIVSHVIEGTSSSVIPIKLR